MNKKDLEIMRHSCAHIMAAAIQKMYPQTKFGIGPIIENGFYYDVEIPKVSLSIENLAKIEKQMKKIISGNVEFVKKEVPIEEAIELFKKLDQPYKVELLQDLKTKGTTTINGEEEPLNANELVTLYQTGEFIDLCRGPHIKSSKEMKIFKLQKVAGAYWRGDENRPMLTRIYGLAFAKQSELDQYLKLMEEAEKRDHRKLGKKLDLFIINEQVGLGLPLWLPKGATLRREIERFALDEYLKRGYQEVRTPHLGRDVLFQTSGHLDFYKDGMYTPMLIDDETYYIKPMNCPFHVKIYQHTPKSYRDLPIRYTELGTVYRYEKSGTLHGLTRVRGFTQDDAHIICTKKQLIDELIDVIDLTKYILETFDFTNFKVVLSTRDSKNKDKYLGTDADWDLAENGLKTALDKTNWKYEEEPGEAVFYGPKIDVKVTDAIGREWQISTIQLDFNLPLRFEMNYIDDQGNKVKPFMLHRALLGSLERFTGVLIEHYAGAFPVWLSPVQISLLPVGADHKEYCYNLADKFRAEGFRVEVDDANETIGNKIRKATGQKIPYLLVIGDKEINSDKLNIRLRGSDKLLELTEAKFIQRVKEEMADKKDK